MLRGCVCRPILALQIASFLPRIILSGSTGGVDKSLARPGRKQATATEDFDFHISYL